jgi:hypothetical protein
MCKQFQDTVVMEKMEQCDVGHRLKDECALHTFGTNQIAVTKCKWHNKISECQGRI